jgi:tetratricopeptide (TPR) repeat protein
LHGAGKVHRDVKPSNVLVTPEGRVVLLDFGVAADLRARASGPRGGEEDAMVGTPLYMSPEQAVGEDVSPASDWYSVGVLLYRVLVGRTPFEGTSADVLTRKATLEAPLPGDSVEGIPPDLDRLCRALLRLNPAERPNGRQILRMLGATRSSAPPVASASAAGGPLLGRDEPMQTLRDAFEEMRLGKTIVVRIAGRAGTGKTALVHHFLDEVSARGDVNVLEGRTYERESVPYKAFDGVIDALSRALMQQEEADGTLALPRHAWALGQLFPVLRRVPTIQALPTRTSHDVQKTRRRAFGALREIFGSVARRRPLVVHLDAVQWGDVDSAALLTDLVRQPGAPPLLLVMCYREEDAATSAFLSELGIRWADAAFEAPEVRELVLGPLAVADAQKLALALLGEDNVHTRQAARAIAKESRGNPLLIEELTRTHRGRAPDASGTLANATLEEMIARRLERLPPETRRLVEIVAVAGRPVPTTLLVEAAGDGQEGATRVASPDAQRFVRTGFREGHEVVEPLHDRVREIIVAQVSAPALADYHRRLANAVEAAPAPDLEALAVHLLGAGDLAKAASYAERAAVQADEKLALDHAARLFRMAYEARRDLGQAEEAQRLAVQVARSLEQAGRAKEAGEAYLRAAENATGMYRLELQRAGGEQLLGAGQIQRGKAVVCEVLAKMGIRVPRSPLGAVFWLIVYRVWMGVTGLRFRERGSEEVSLEDRVRLDGLFSMIAILGYVDVILVACVTAQATILALARGDRMHVGRALGLQYLQWAVARRARRSKRDRMVEREYERILATFGPSVAQFRELMKGLIDYHRGDFASALARLDAAQKRRTRRVAGDAAADIYACLASMHLGRVREVRRRTQRLLREVEDRGDLFTEVSLRLSAVHAELLVADDEQGARRNVRQTIARWPDDQFYLQHWYAMIAEAEIEEYCGNAEAAWQRFERDKVALEKSYLLRTPVIAVFHSAFAGRAAVGAAVRGNSRLRQARLAEARRHLAVLEREELPPGPLYANMLRASLAHADGDKPQAISAMREAFTHAETSSMFLFAMTIRHRLGTLLDDVEGEVLVAHAKEALEAEGVRAPARWSAHLVPGAWGEDALREEAKSLEASTTG